MRNRIIAAAILVLSIVGMLLCHHLTVSHYEFLSGQREGSSYCNVSSIFSCDNVTVSRFAKLGNFSVSSFGLIFYLVVFLLTSAFIAGEKREQNRRLYSTLLVCLTTVAAAFALYLVGVSLFVIESVCIPCFISHLLTLAIFTFTLLIAKQNIFQAVQNFFKWLISCFRRQDAGFGKAYLLIVWLVIGAIALTMPLLWDYSMNQQTSKNYDKVFAIKLQQLKESKQYRIDTVGSPRKGDAKAAVEVVEFSDFGCPFCKRAAFMYQAVLNNFKGSAKLVFKHFPLDSNCNYRLQRSMHEYACDLAQASVCAEKQSKFWQYHDKVFSLEGKAKSSTSRQIATAIGLNLDDFDKCMNSGDSRQQVRQDLEQGYDIGITGTPALLINGRLITGLVPAPVLEKLIQVSLEKSSGL